MKTKTDIYNRKWNLPKKELCPTCGQPDSVGDCNHKKLKNKEVILLGGELPEKPMPYKIKIYQPALSNNQLCSFWYNGQVAIIPTKDGY